MPALTDVQAVEIWKITHALEINGPQFVELCEKLIIFSQ